MRPSLPSRNWFRTLGLYVTFSAGLHLAWEVIQLPFYTIWRGGSPGQIILAVVHCSAGDLMIAALTLVIALVAFGSTGWPAKRFTPVLGTTLILGVGNTLYSEWINTVVRKSWAYSEIMPTLPGIGTGLTPLLQWLIVPSIALMLASRDELMRARER